MHIGYTRWSCERRVEDAHGDLKDEEEQTEHGKGPYSVTLLAGAQAPDKVNHDERSADENHAAVDELKRNETSWGWTARADQP
jgi:hypothetical protein